MSEVEGGGGERERERVRGREEEGVLLLLHLFLLSFGYSLPSRLEAGEGSDTHTHTHEHTHTHTLWRSYDKPQQRKLDPAALYCSHCCFPPAAVIRVEEAQRICAADTDLDILRITGS